ncbi:hypothetical protein B0I31_113190 [Saccharothrix carnea]|uniref:CN hydrolase domain-containing protein n=1 Tax=Saccharothrix carnea TaxID=1280637 RepID=A0A2P8I219_SACCR|nr:hypothetical protein B0I31_113190 [Saccharothrix carnea]
MNPTSRRIERWLKTRVPRPGHYGEKDAQPVRRPGRLRPTSSLPLPCWKKLNVPTAWGRHDIPPYIVSSHSHEAPGRALTAAACPARAEPGDVKANVATATRLVSPAVRRGARLVPLPELFLCAYHPVILARDPEVVTSSPPRTGTSGTSAWHHWPRPPARVPLRCSSGERVVPGRPPYQLWPWPTPSAGRTTGSSTEARPSTTPTARPSPRRLMRVRPWRWPSSIRDAGPHPRRPDAVSGRLLECREGS